MMLGKTTAEALGACYRSLQGRARQVQHLCRLHRLLRRSPAIIDGYADGTFRPSGTLTGFAFLKMLLTALGYDSDHRGLHRRQLDRQRGPVRPSRIGLTDGNDNFVGTQCRHP